MIKVPHHKAKSAVGTRPGNISGIYTTYTKTAQNSRSNILYKEENDTYLKKTHICTEVTARKHKPSSHLYESSAINVTF